MRRSRSIAVAQGSGQYRRGAVMGLTIAEIFLLLAFMLLLLLALWRYEEFVADEAEAGFRELSTEDQRAVLEAVDRGYAPALVLLGGSGMSPEDVKHAARALSEGARLVDTAEVDELLGALSDLSDRERAEFTELVRAESIEDVLAAAGLLLELPEAQRKEAARVLEKEWLETLLKLLAQGATPKDVSDLGDALAEGALVVRSEEEAAQFTAWLALPADRRETLAELLSEQDASRVADALERLEALSSSDLETDTIKAAAELRKRLSAEEIEKLLRSESLTAAVKQVIGGQETVASGVAEQLESQLGELVSSIGGEIDPIDGKITLPDRFFFQVGDHQITAQMRDVLRQFCPKWLSIIHENRSGILEARIEGHASSDWTEGSTADEAFLGNMSLSQRRAASVLRFCLSSTSGEIDREWLRRNVVAVGLSSGRPILDEAGKEDRVKSRRVVFGFVTRR